MNVFLLSYHSFEYPCVNKWENNTQCSQTVINPIWSIPMVNLPRCEYSQCDHTDCIGHKGRAAQDPASWGSVNSTVLDSSGSAQLAGVAGINDNVWNQTLRQFFWLTYSFTAHLSYSLRWLMKNITRNKDQVLPSICLESEGGSVERGQGTPNPVPAASGKNLRAEKKTQKMPPCQISKACEKTSTAVLSCWSHQSISLPDKAVGSYKMKVAALCIKDSGGKVRVNCLVCRKCMLLEVRLFSY